MTLNLAITNVEKLDNGVSTRLRLDRHGALIGRSPQADWSLPDPQHYISSIHCEIDYSDGAYILADKSTNGTLLNGAPTRMIGTRVLQPGDNITIGPYTIAVSLEGEAAAAAAAAGPPPPTPVGAWGGWEDGGGSSPPVAAAPAASVSDWGTPAPQSAISGMGALSSSWAPPATVEPAAPAGASVWAEPVAATTPASAWSSAVAPPPADPSAVDVWGQLAQGNAVDWSRGGFAAAPEPVALAPVVKPDPFGLSPAPSAAAEWGVPAPSAPAVKVDASAKAEWGTPAVGRAPSTDWGAPKTIAPAPSVAPPPPPLATVAVGAAAGEWQAFLAAAGITAADVKGDSRAAMTAAGGLLKRLVAGMVVMLEARARAKAQLGAQSTSLEFDGNNPLKFARAPERAIAQLISPPERGFMSADRAVEDAFKDLQAHQMATLTAMQGALGATLARFSPQAIRDRAETRGLLARILPSARDAELWGAYEKEFEGVARGSDEAFMDVFAKEFRQAYDKVSADMKRR